MLYFFLILVLLILTAIYIYWRFFFFFRNPERTIPLGNNIVSAADGTVVYIKEFKGDLVPISIKKKRNIKLVEIFKMSFEQSHESMYLIGVFMHPTSVHVNRAPISGKVEKVVYTKNKNLPMTMMWWRVLFGLRPYEFYSRHVLENERNTLLIKGHIPLYVVQIADIYVNKIECWVKEGDEIKKGERFGMIKLGSQVDILFPSKTISNIAVKVGQKVKAGETILAHIN
jgi:phosphatidylserine decarboxylase